MGAVCIVLGLLGLTAWGHAALRWGRATPQAEQSRPQAMIPRLVLAGVIGRPGTGRGELREPSGVSLDPTGSLYIADTGNDRVQKFDSRGAFVRAVGDFGWDDEQFNRPTDIDAETGLDVYVVDSQNRRVQRFDRDLNFLTSQVIRVQDFATLEIGSLHSLAVGSAGELYVTDVENDHLLKIDAFGRPEIDFPGLRETTLRAPCGVAASRSGEVYVADSGNDRVSVFDPFGRFVRTVGEGFLSRPEGVALAPDGILAVADTGHDRILFLSPDGKLLTAYGASGGGLGSFRAPRGLAIESKTMLYVCDAGNNRIQKFRLEREVD